MLWLMPTGSPAAVMVVWPIDAVSWALEKKPDTHTQIGVQ